MAKHKGRRRKARLTARRGDTVYEQNFTVGSDRKNTVGAAHERENMGDVVALSDADRQKILKEIKDEDITAGRAKELFSLATEDPSLIDQEIVDALIENSEVPPALKQEMREVAEMEKVPVLEFEPRMKDDGQGGEVDIANTAYRDLPPKWQAENKAAAEGAVTAILSSTDGGASLRDTVANPTNRDALIERASDLIHRDWLSRNGEWAPEEQKLPYAELSEEEKEKDRVLARKAVDVILSAQTESSRTGGDTAALLGAGTEGFASTLHDEWREARRITPRA